jgi:O-antigen/teichoic acid export membrane protein
MKQSHLIAINTLLIWGTTALQMIPPLIMAPFLLRTLGETGYGEYALIWSLLGAIIQLETSLQSGGVKYGAAFLAQGRIEDVNKVVSSTFVFSVGLGVLSCLAIAVTAFASFRASQGMMISLMIVGVMMIFLVPTTPYAGILRAKQRHYAISIFAIASQYAGLLLTILWFRFVGPSVEALIAILAGTLLLSKLAQVPLAYKLVPGLKNRFRMFDRATFRMVVSFGTLVVLMTLCQVVHTTGMRWLSGLLVSTSFVAHLAIFLMPGTMMSQIVQAMTITVMPAASAYEASGNQVMLRELLLKSVRYTVLMVSAGILAVGLLVRHGLRLWVGSEYQFLDVFTILNLVGVSMSLCASSAHQMLKGLGALRKILTAFIVGYVAIPAAVFLTIYLIWESPYLAVTIGLLLGNTVAGIMQLRSCARAVQINRKVLVVRGFLQPLSPAAVSLALVLAIVGLSGLDSLVGRLLAAILAVAIVFGGFYFFIAGPEERRQFKDFIGMIRGRLFGPKPPAASPLDGPDD